MNRQTPPPPPPHVSKADGNVILVEGVVPDMARQLEALGFRAVPGQEGVWTAPALDVAHKATLFARLRDLSVCFSRGREWNPAEVFEWLREEGHLSGPFKSIAWKRPGEWFIREETGPA